MVGRACDLRKSFSHKFLEMSLALKIREHVLIAGAVLLYPFFARKAYRRKQSKGMRFLVMPRANKIGDIICATPVFQALKERYPDSFLAVLVGDYFNTADILKGNPHIDEIILIENDEFEKWFGMSRFFKKIREKQFNCSINLAASSLGTLITLFGVIPKRIKITHQYRPFTERLTDWMNTEAVPYIVGIRIPIVYLQTLRSLNVPMPERIKKTVVPDTQSDAKTEDFLRKRGIVAGDFLIGMSVSAGSLIKEWSLKRWATLSKKLAAAHGAKIIFIGGPEDHDKIEEVMRNNGGIGISTVGHFSLRELPSLMKRFRLFLAVDSGTVHIADALGVPLIDIVGPVDPNEQAPEGDMSIILTPPGNISPSVFAFRPQGDPKIARRAVEATSVEQVFAACERLIKKIGDR